MKKIKLQPIWFDSLGAKSMATLVQTPDVSILIDPGVAIMQPSFPADTIRKGEWKSMAIKEIKKASKKADITTITHYHYDHYSPDSLEIYKTKTILAKSPNEYINDSQRTRAYNFYKKLCKKFDGEKLDDKLKEKEKKNYPDPLKDLPLAKEKDFGDYQDRREELLKKWRKRFYRRVANWNTTKRIPSMTLDEVKVDFADGKEYQFGKTTIQFTRPLFHGIEYSRVGWVISPMISYEDEKIIHSSDISGIYIEDYAKWLWEEDPNVLILDGPPTYLLGYLFNKINLRRCVNNTCEILRKTENLELLIYDHHLLREKKYKERTNDVWETGEKENIRVITAAEFKGKTPIIETCN